METPISPPALNPADVRLRVFISSPGDVAEERVVANKLVRRLADEYVDRLWIEPVLWEHEPLLATGTFQSQIPQPSECQIVICILWSRLGTRLPPDITRPDASRFASGTEYEFENAIEGRKKNGFPDLLVYRKTAKPMVSLEDDDDLERRRIQKKALDGFIQKWFFDVADGSLKGAFHAFDTTAAFEQVLEEHLRKLIQRRIPAGAASRPAARIRPSWTAGSPYRGLEVFEFAHARVFFGRTQAIGDVLNALRANAAAGRAFLLIVGVSGGGKSSLVRAGVLPLLTQPGVIEGVGMWRRAAFRPSDGGDNPLRALAAALLAPEALPELGSDGTTADQLAELLRQTPSNAPLLIKGGLSQAAAAAALQQKIPQQAEARLVIVADQLEELFTVTAFTPEQRQELIAALSALARSGKVWVIATLRGDFYHRAFALPELVALQEGSGQYALPMPTEAEMAQMIWQPAQAAGLSFEVDPETKASLDDVLRDAARNSPESLPLLEFALEELYQRKTDDGMLTYAAYRDLGGVEGALTQRAESVFASLEPQVQQTFGRVMRALVDIRDGDALARQQAPLGTVAATPQAKALVDAFIRSRLFATDRTESGEAAVRVTHEALLRNWSRVRKWLEQDKEMLMVRSRVSAAAARWQANARRSDMLLPAGKALEEAEQLLAAGFEVNNDSLALISASRRRARFNRRVRKGVMMALCCMLAGITAFASYASYQHNEALRLAGEKGSLAESNGRLADEKGKLADEMGKLAGEKGKLADENGKLAEERSAALGRESQQRERAEWELYRNQLSAASSALDQEHPDRYIDVLDSPGRAIGILDSCRWDFRGWEYDQLRSRLFEPTRVIQHLGQFVSCADFSADDQMLAAGCNGDLILFDAHTLKSRQVFSGHAGAINSVRFSPNVKFAVSGGLDKTVRLWPLDGSPGRQADGQAEITCVTVSPDNRQIGSGDKEGNLVVRDAESFKTVLSKKISESAVRAIAFLPGGKDLGIITATEFITLQIASGKTDVRKFDSTTASAVDAAAFNRNGTAVTIAVQTAWVSRMQPDGTWSDWKAIGASSRLVKQIFIPNEGDWVITCDSHDARVLTAGNATRVASIRDTIGSAHCMAVSGSGRQVAVGSEGLDAEIGITNVREEAFAPPIVLPPGPTVTGLVYRPDHKLLVVARGANLRDLLQSAKPIGSAKTGADDTGRLEIWNYPGPSAIPRSTYALTSQITSMAVSPDASTAVAGFENGDVTYWQLGTQPLPPPIPKLTSAVNAVAFSPDGTMVATAGVDKCARVWNVRTGALIVEFKKHTLAVSSVAFSPSGDWLATGSTDKAIRLWPLRQGLEPKTFLGHGGAVTSIAFSPAGTRLVSGSPDHTTRMWDVETGRQLWVGRETEGKRIEFAGLIGDENEVQRVMFTHDGQRVASFCGFPGFGDRLRIWDVNTGQSSRLLPIGTGESVGNSGAGFVAFAPDDSLVGFVGPLMETAKLMTWHVADRRINLPLVLRQQSGEIRGCAFSPDGRWIASGSEENAVVVYDRKSGSLERQIKLNGPCRAVAFMDGGNALVCSAGPDAVAISGTDWNHRVTFKGHGADVVTVSAAGPNVATGSRDKTARVWDASTGALIQTFGPLEGKVTAVLLIDGGSRLITTNWEGVLRVWDVKTGKLERASKKEAHDQGINCLAASIDGRQLLTGGLDGTVKVWEFATLNRVGVFQAHDAEAEVNGIAALPDGIHAASGGADGVLNIWEIGTGKSRNCIWVGGNGISSMAADASGSVLTGCKDNFVRYWTTVSDLPIQCFTK